VGSRVFELFVDIAQAEPVEAYYGVQVRLPINTHMQTLI
jgi:hypothetical protein